MSTNSNMSPSASSLTLLNSRIEDPDRFMRLITSAYNGSPASVVDKARPLEDDDIVIAVMGPTGAGKSTFISHVTGHDVDIGKTLVSCTSDIGIIRLQSKFCGVAGFGDLVLVDTPGFDDTNMSDVDILKMIYEWLKTSEVKLSGLLYFHRISDNRMAGTPLRNLGMFEKLCGKKMFHSVVLVTTMWDEVDETIGEQREKELKNKYWNDMTSRGSQTKRFSPAGDGQTRFETLQNLISVAAERNEKRALTSVQDHRGRIGRLFRLQLSRSNPSFRWVLLQDEAMKGCHLPNTSAGRQLYSKLESIAERRESLLQRLKAEVEASIVDGDQENMQYLMEELDKIQREFHEISVEMQRMKIPMTQRMWRAILGRG